MSIDTRVFGDPATCYTCADSLATLAAGVNQQLTSARAGRTESEHEFIGTTGDEFRRRLDSIISGTTEVADQTDAIATALRTFADVYGVAVMRSVVTEKTSRVMEMMVAAVKPRSLMAGKILGVGGAGIIQVAIWLGMGAAMLAYREELIGLPLTPSA